jgi:hypothetical protein
MMQRPSSFGYRPAYATVNLLEVRGWDAKAPLIDGSPVVYRARTGEFSPSGGAIFASDDTDSFSPTTGALIVAGGVGVKKNVHCGAMVSAVTFTATSDARLKTHICDARGVAARLAGVPARSYEFISEPGRERYGVLAQDLLEAKVDGSVFRTDTGALSVDYNALTALLLDRVNVLEERVRALERG